MGGKPDLAKQHFEQAISYSGGDNLMVKTLFARYYARMVFDQKLHDDLLQDVLKSPAEKPGLTLINTLAKDQAQQLLNESSEFF